MKARGKREAQRNASPLVTSNILRALKVRNINLNYSALSELQRHSALLPGATRLTLFGACPWLSYSAPLALHWGLLEGDYEFPAFLLSHRAKAAEYHNQPYY
jgi:hypothetical protein